MKNITLSADEALIELARKTARQRMTTLNAEFRLWLEQYAASDEKRKERVHRYHALMDEFAGISSGGRHFSRDELNER